jgi:hypothetical protein
VGYCLNGRIARTDEGIDTGKDTGKDVGRSRYFEPEVLAYGYVFCRYVARQVPHVEPSSCKVDEKFGGDDSLSVVPGCRLR